MRKFLKILIVAVGGLMIAHTTYAGGTPSSLSKREASESSRQKKQKIVILKLDDVVNGREGQVVPERWQRVSDYLEGKKVKASFGVIGYSLVEDNPVYFQWIKERAARGIIEFWNHGFVARKAEDPKGEFERSYEEQLSSLRMTDSLAKVKLGLTLSTWGPNWSGTNEDTDRALTQVPSIRMTFGYPPKAIHYKGVVLPRNIDLEYPTHNPDFEKFLEAYNGRWKDLDFFFLQGHPNSWDTATRWSNFVKVVEFLESEGAIFVTPSEFYEMMQKK